MLYLKRFCFQSEGQEWNFFMEQKRTCYDTFYPYQVFPQKGLLHLDFEPVTILYGGNGSGKTTVLNVIAEKLRLQRESLYNRSNFFGDYIAGCSYSLASEVWEIPRTSRVITSDDVFDYILNVRCLNEGIHEKREELLAEYTELKYSQFQLKSLEDYDKLKKVNLSRSKSQSKYIRRNLMDNVKERSNGESAFMYFVEKIREDGLYLLDEPENSLSPQRQLELLEFIKDSARFFGCQFIISTHSPFLLSMKGARIYNLDQSPVSVQKWTELENVRTYYEFFKQHKEDFL